MLKLLTPIKLCLNGFNNMFKSSHEKANKNGLTVFPEACQSYQSEKDPFDPSVSICLLTSEPYGINLNIYSYFHYRGKNIKCVG